MEWKKPFDELDLILHTDQRGSLFEVFRFDDFNIPPSGYVYTFSINPHHRRGDHYHHKKVEWFTCVHGKAKVLLSTVDGQFSRVVDLSADNPKLVYAPAETDAVDLVIYAFTHGRNGDLFVQKAPAATLGTLAQALKETYASVNPKYGETEIKIIGPRHGEKLYETLVTSEEMAQAEDMGGYYRIPCDARDLNYDRSYFEGTAAKIVEPYHSHNTRRLDVEGMKELLLKLRFVKEDLGLIPRTKIKEIRSE